MCQFCHISVNKNDKIGFYFQLENLPKGIEIFKNDKYQGDFMDFFGIIREEKLDRIEKVENNFFGVEWCERRINSTDK